MRRSYLSLQEPYRVHNLYWHPSWLAAPGDHPAQIEALMADARSGRLPVELRRTDDIEALLRSPRYRLGRLALKAGDHADRAAKGIRHPRAQGRALLRRLREGEQP